MKITKFLLGAVRLLLLLLLLLMVLPARADVGTKSFGITNSIAAALTNTSAATIGNVVAIPNRDNCALQFKFAGSTSQTGNFIITFARSPDNVNWETTPQFNWVVAANNTTAVVAWTQLPNTTVGAAGYLKVISIGNANTTCIGTNASLILVDKSLR